METVELKAIVRDKIGGREPNRLRRQDIIPGIVYGQKKTPVPIQVERGSLEHSLHTSAGENVLIKLMFEKSDVNDVTVLIKEVQHNIITDQISHVDFHTVSLTEKIQVKVHVHAKGEAQGVKDGGMLDVILREIEVECLPTQIPERIDIDVSSLTIGHSLHVSDLVLPEGATCLEDAEAVVVVVIAPKLEEEGAEGEEIEGEASTSMEPEVIKKGKEETPEGEA